MQQIRTIMIVLTLFGVLSAPVSFAQQREPLPSQRSEVLPAVPKASPPATAQAPGAHRLSVTKVTTFIGSAVVNRQGENLGKIEDLVIDPATGNIVYAALSHGSILGMGGKLFAIAWKSMDLQPDGTTFILDLPKEKLESASGFDKNTWPRRPDPALSAAARSAETGTSPPTAPRAGTGISATVQAVNAPAETITLETEHGESVNLRAPTAMLARLQAGDSVEVKMVGTQITELLKKDNKE